MNKINEVTSRYLVVWHRKWFQIIDTDNRCEVVVDRLRTREDAYTAFEVYRDAVAS
jgi:hypothetical protein